MTLRSARQTLDVCCLFNLWPGFYAAAMHSGTLSHDQRQKLLAGIQSRRDWLQRLHERMRALEWKPGCEMYRATLAAIDAHDMLLKTLGRI